MGCSDLLFVVLALPCNYSTLQEFDSKLYFYIGKKMSEDYLYKLLTYKKLFGSHKPIKLADCLQKELDPFLSGAFRKLMQNVRPSENANNLSNKVVLKQKSPYEIAYSACLDIATDQHFILHPANISKIALTVRKFHQKAASKPTAITEAKVPILNLSNASDTDIAILLLIFCDTDTKKSRSEMLQILSNIVPKVPVDTPATKHCEHQENPGTCSTCQKKITRSSKTYECYWCCGVFCESCHSGDQFFPRLGKAPRQLCRTCVDHFHMLDVKCWTEASVACVGRKDLKAALGCLAMALSIGAGSYKNPVKTVINSLLKSQPELAFIVTVHLMTQTSKHSTDMLKVTVLATTALKNMADRTLASGEKWDMLLAAQEASCYVQELQSSLDEFVELPTFRNVYREITESLHCEKDRKLASYCAILDTLWLVRDLKGILELLTSEDGLYVDAVEEFVEGKEAFLGKMLPMDRYPIIFLRGILKLKNKDIRSGLADIELAAWNDYEDSLRKEVVNLFLHLLNGPVGNLFCMDEIRGACSNVTLLSSELIFGCDENNFLLIPPPSKIRPPFSRAWPSISITGYSVKCHQKYEQAVQKQVAEKKWGSWEAGLAYIDYIPSCGHASEFSLCFLHAAFWFLDDLETNTRRDISDLFARKELIVNILQQAHGSANIALHPGMQLYVARLALRALINIFQLKIAEQVTTKEDCEFFKQLLHTVIKTGRLNPFWQAPTVPVSESLLMLIKSKAIHSDFLLGLQDIDPSRCSVSDTELKYQLYENDLRCVTPLQDSASAHHRAMEALLHDEGYSWEDVTNTLTSHLSPRDQEGWLIPQKFGIGGQSYAEIVGFVVDTDADNPSIRVVVTPADPRRGRLGLFSQSDIHAALQLDAANASPIFFSLDPPSPNERFHPFQSMRMSSEKLQHTDLLHTLFQTDYLLKSFSVGAEVSSKPPFNQRPCSEGLTKDLPPALKKVTRPVAERGHSLSNIHRFWIQADELMCHQEQTGSKIEFRFGTVKMSVRSHPMFHDSDGKLQDTLQDEDPDSPEVKFASDLTKHYTELGLHFPSFLRLRELCKLQVYAALVHSVVKDLKAKASGVGITVSEEFLQEIQSDALSQHQHRTDEVLRGLNSEISTWPEAQNEHAVSREVDRVMRSLPCDVRACYSDIEPHVRDALRKKDQSVVSQVVDTFVQASGSRLSHHSLERYVRAWLSSRTATAAVELRNFVCASLPLPTSSEIRQSSIKFAAKRYNSVNRLVSSFSASRSANRRSKFCSWVPAAVLTKKDDHSKLICYGGVLLTPTIKNSFVSSFQGPKEYVNLRNWTPAANQSRSHVQPSYRASAEKAVAASSAGSSNEGAPHSGPPPPPGGGAPPSAPPPAPPGGGGGGKDGGGGGDDFKKCSKLDHKWDHVFKKKDTPGHYTRGNCGEEGLKHLFMVVAITGTKTTTGLHDEAVKRGEVVRTNGTVWVHLDAFGAIKSAGDNALKHY